MAARPLTVDGMGNVTIRPAYSMWPQLPLRELNETLGIAGLPQIDFWRPD